MNNEIYSEMINNCRLMIYYGNDISIKNGGKMTSEQKNNFKNTIAGIIENLDLE